LNNVKPLSVPRAALLFASTSGLIVVALYWGVPALQEIGLTFLQAYLACFYTPFMLLLVISIVAYRLEGNEWSWEAFAARYRLRRMDRRTLVWTVALILIGGLAGLGLSFTGAWLAGMRLFAPPDYFPAEINPTKEMAAGVFMDTPLAGQWWIVLFYSMGWFFNIAGEELLWRGYLLPRQEARHGEHAWLVHGAMWALWHVFFRWNLLAILPAALAIPFVVQRTKNTWVGIIAHGIANFIPLAIIIAGVVS
jgi:membrane protease YdiL (CAAX protease family)